MKRAVVVSATEDYLPFVKVLFHSLETRGGLPDDFERVVLNQATCDFATALPIPAGALDVIPETAFVPPVPRMERASVSRLLVPQLLKDYDYVVSLDADMVCLRDCGELWSSGPSRHPFLACRDVAARHYYPGQIARLDLDPYSIINGGLLVFSPPADSVDILDQFALGKLRAEHSYGCCEQGYWSYYWQKFRSGELGWLHPSFNACVDVHFQDILNDHPRILHFPGPPRHRTLLETRDGGPLFDQWRTIAREVPGIL